MKKLFLLVAFAAATSSYAQSSDLSLTSNKRELKKEKREIDQAERVNRKEERAIRNMEVNYMTRETFRVDFPDATSPVFHKGMNFDEVSYWMNGRSFIAFYDNQSKLVGTTTVKDLSDLPASARMRISKKYIARGYTPVRTILFDDNEYSGTDMWMYGVPLADADMYFVELKKAEKAIVLKVSMNGNVAFFKKL